MDLDYWKKRWQDNQTHWHVDQIHPLLQKYYPLLPRNPKQTCITSPK
ncbi:MAG: hypothetical protein R3A45_06315 [Bdellovibrionota bacterium]